MQSCAEKFVLCKGVCYLLVKLQAGMQAGAWAAHICNTLPASHMAASLQRDWLSCGLQHQIISGSISVLQLRQQYLWQYTYRDLNTARDEACVLRRHIEGVLYSPLLHHSVVHGSDRNLSSFTSANVQIMLYCCTLDSAVNVLCLKLLDMTIHSQLRACSSRIRA